MEDLIVNAIRRVTGYRDIHLEIPEREEFGEYSSNVAMQMFAGGKEILRQVQDDKVGSDILSSLSISNSLINKLTDLKSPRELAEEITKQLKTDKELLKVVDKIEVACPGFINFYLKTDVFLQNLNEIIKMGDEYGKSGEKTGQKILLEHTSPNPQTTIMLGHLRNNFLGMTMSNIYEFQGAKVVRDAINNDRGIHICRSMYGYLMFAGKETGLTKEELKNFKDVPEARLENITNNIVWRDLLKKWIEKQEKWFVPEELELKSDHANLIWYVLGSKAFKKFDHSTKQVKEILLAWEKEESDIWQLWRLILSWSEKGYQETYRRIGSVHDWVWHESELYKGGKELVEEGLKKGIFQKSEGAIVTNLKKYNLPDTVVIKSDGTSTYIVFDLNLTLQKQKKFQSDIYIWTIGQEQSHYFRQMFAVCEQLGLGKRRDFFHLSYALINFKGSGKMSTREGSVVMADEILDELENKVKKIMKSSDQKLRRDLTAEDTKQLVSIIALAAIKYSLLKVGRETTIFYDINESISLEGYSGPYLQYTFARTQSVLDKSEARNPKYEINTELEINEEEYTLLRFLYQFPGIIEEAAKNYSPNLLCNYLYTLAQKFNTFYNRYRILESGESPEGIAESEDVNTLNTGHRTQTADFRLALTSATGQVLKTGLNLLGIEAPERM